MPEPIVVRAMREFKADLLRQEQTQMREMARRWLDVERSLEGNISALAQAVERKQQAGETTTRAQIQEMERYRRLLAQARGEVGRYERYAEDLIARRQAELEAVGVQQAIEAIQLSFFDAGVRGTFYALPVDAVESMAGLAGDGSPLRDLLEQAWPTAVDGLTRALLDATAMGRNPRDTARLMANGLADGLNRMMVIARTEQLRAYRDATRQAYQRSGVVKGYKRIAAHDTRTCMGCLMAEGKISDTSQVFEAHPQCRCTSIPVVENLPEIGYEYGPGWFGKQGEAVQRDMMGKAMFDAWQAGKFELPQLVSVRHNETWGDAIVPTPLGELVR